MLPGGRLKRYLTRRRGTDREWPEGFDRRVLAAVAGPDGAATVDYDAVFSYFLTGFLHRRLPEGSLAAYPGAWSWNGPRNDLMEGFTRFAPLAAAWLAGGRPRVAATLDGGSADVLELLREGLLNGTDPSSPGYWGEIRDRSQRTVEAADVARVVWLTRGCLWEGLTAGERRRVTDWLHQVNGREVTDNNWHLFPVLVHEVTRALGHPDGRADAAGHYARLKSFYRGGGWFSDGPGERFDYYNAWAIHYDLHFLRRVNPAFDAAFLDGAMGEFAAGYKHLVSPTGVPILGRSICYRMATPAPLVGASAFAPGVVPPGMARRALDAVWAHFIRKGALGGGTVTQGYCRRPDLRLLDNYSGPASCLWSLRSLVAAFALPASAPLWTAPLEPLPVERGGFRLEIPEIGWTVEGDGATREVRIRTKRPPSVEPRIASYTPLHRAAEALRGRPCRPENEAAKYGRSSYSSTHPFCGCE